MRCCSLGCRTWSHPANRPPSKTPRTRAACRRSAARTSASRSSSTSWRCCSSSSTSRRCSSSPGERSTSRRRAGGARGWASCSSKCWSSSSSWRWATSTCGSGGRCNGIEPYSGVRPVKRVLETKEVAGQSPNYLLAKVQDLIDWAVNSSRANSLWPMPFGTACCAIEFMATAASRYDFARFGMERQAFSPRQADVLICAGPLPFKLAPVLRRIYDQMPQPKWVISRGAWASTGGIFDNYAMVQGIDTIVPVDVYVPGCPPRPEGLLYGVLLLHKKIKGESLFDRVPRREEQLLDERGLRLPPEQIDEISEPFGNSVHQFRSA